MPSPASPAVSSPAWPRFSICEGGGLLWLRLCSLVLYNLFIVCKSVLYLFVVFSAYVFRSGLDITPNSYIGISDFPPIACAVCLVYCFKWIVILVFSCPRPLFGFLSVSVHFAFGGASACAFNVCLVVRVSLCVWVSVGVLSMWA